MAQEHDRQGTGKHGHKDTQEPYPHRRGESGDAHGRQQAQGRQDGGSGGQSGKAQQGAENESLKAREYRDQQGNVHHHTKTYMEQHDREGGGQGSDRQQHRDEA